MDLIHNLYTGVCVALTFQNILYCKLRGVVGQIIGVLPALVRDRDCASASSHLHD